ncbi:MAG: hypothetical protein AB8I08_02750 [Sandaracinaceae bacterium]
MLAAALVAAVLTSAGLGAAPASAQLECQRVESQQEEARALFVAGLGAVEALRWSDAVDRLERAYEISCQYAALYNLGIALRALGRHREARDTFAHLLSEYDGLPDEVRSQAETYRREETARVATVELGGLTPDQHPEISFDGRPVDDTGARPLAIETDAGSHSLVARIPDFQPFLWEGALGDGQRESVMVDFVPVAAAEGFDPTWLIVSIVGVLLIGGGIALGVALYEDGRLRPLYPSRVVQLGTL